MDDERGKKNGLTVRGCALMRSITGFFSRQFMEDSGRWFLWLPVWLGCGIAIYFSLSFEPPLFVAGLVFLLGVAGFLVLREQDHLYPLGAVVLMIATGFAASKLRSEIVAAPVVVKRTGPVMIEGRLEEITARPAGGVRLTIRPRAIERLGQGDMPRRIRVSARMDVTGFRPGEGIILRAVLMPPPGPSFPGGFDYARMAWFEGAGATGYVISKPRHLEFGEEALPGRVSSAVARMRQAVTRRIVKALEGEKGAVAAALITGERGGLRPELRDRLRDAGLAHLLAISGLHMALFGGALFYLSRALFALSARLALGAPIKKWAAAVALSGSAGYLILSGGSIATQRAFIMTGIMFLAIFLDRRALSMRNVALAALVILLWRPESLFNVSFQMSFAAVIALIATYETGVSSSLWRRVIGAGKAGPVLKASIYILGIALTSLVAGGATAPFAAYHFNRAAIFGVLGNMAAVPVMAFLVMPAALASLILLPLGLEYYPLQIMGFGIEAVNRAAMSVAGLPGAALLIPGLHVISLPLIVAGGLWLCLWRRSWRLAGLGLIVPGFLLAPLGARPDVLIERSASNIAIRGQDGKLAFMDARKGSYSARKWLEADGDRRGLKQASGGGAFSCDELACTARLRNGGELAFIKHAAAVKEECGRAQIVISKISLQHSCKRPGLAIDNFDLKKNGAYSVFLKPDGMEVRHSAGVRGRRPWANWINSGG